MARCTPRAPGHRDDTQGPTAVNTRPVRLPSWTARAPGNRGRRQHSGPTLPQPWRMSLGSHRPLRAQNVSGLLHKQEASLPHLQHAAPAGRTTCTPTPLPASGPTGAGNACMQTQRVPAGGVGSSPSQPHRCPYRECPRPATSALRSTAAAPHPGAAAGACDVLSGPG